MTSREQADNNAEFKALRHKAKVIYNRLFRLYGEPRWSKLDGVSELVSTILSQNTNDSNRDLAYTRLRARFSTWEQVRDAAADAVVDAIRVAGLANQKGPRIQAALQRIAAERGRLNIDFLAEMPVEEGLAWLTSIHGIGPKTASIVLLFCYDKAAFPVDTHIHRLAARLGLIGPKVTADQAHEIMLKLCPDHQYGTFHINIIRHGREICHARSPECERCPLQDLCLYFAAMTQP